MPDQDDNQLELPFPKGLAKRASRRDEDGKDSSDEPMRFSQEEAGSAPTCGTCGEPIRGEVYVNHFGPAHYRCYLREIL